MGISGHYFSKNITTTTTDQDIINTIRVMLNNRHISVKKVTVISSSEFTVSINDVGFSDVYQDVDLIYKLSLGADDVSINKMVIHESGITVFVAIVFKNE